MFTYHGESSYDWIAPAAWASLFLLLYIAVAMVVLRYVNRITAWLLWMAD